MVRRIEKSFSVAVPLAQYNEINKNYLFAEWNGYPYPLAGRLCMAYVREWAEYHLIVDPIEFVFEDEAKHKGQLKWLAEKDKLPTPIFKQKKECIALQPSDLIAWEHHRMLTQSAKTSRREYSAIFERLEKTSHQWEIVKLDDIKRVLERTGTPERDPQYRYQCKIIKRHGERMALIHCSPRANKQQPQKRFIVPNHPSAE